MKVRQAVIGNIETERARVKKKVWEKISKDKKLTARKKRNRMQMEDKTVRIFLFLYNYLFAAAEPRILYAA